VAKGHDEVSDKFDGVGLRHRRGRGFFGSGAACQFTPSIVFRTALAAAGAALSSPSQVERMLFGQAAALQSLFVRLTEGALGAETVPNYDLKFRYALRAQSQCRATLETLAAIENPPVVFARQANVAHGPQQVNNGLARAEDVSSPNELSGEASELRQNGGTPEFAGATDSRMAAVGTLYGSAHSRWKKKVVTKRLEGRQPARTSRAGKDPKAAGAKR